MSILIPVADTGITLNEIPGHIAFYIEIGNCTQRCPGCHSPHLSMQNTMTFYTIESLVDIVEIYEEKGADAIVLMGGTTNDIPVDDLVALLMRLGHILPVCLYSGSDDVVHDFTIAERAWLRWLKTGSYDAVRGGLTSPTTNQRFYKCDRHYHYTSEGIYTGSHAEFIDQTYLFQDKQKGALCS